MLSLFLFLIIYAISPARAGEAECARKLAPHEMIDTLSPNEQFLRDHEIPDDYHLDPVFCVNKVSLRYWRYLGYEPNALEHFNYVCAVTSTLDVAMPPEGLKDTDVRMLLRHVVQVISDDQDYEVRYANYGSPAVSKEPGTAVPAFVLWEAHHPKRATLVKLIGLDSAGQLHDYQTGLPTQFSRWVVLRTAIPILGAAPDSYEAQIEDPRFKVIINGVLRASLHPVHKFPTWTFESSRPEPETAVIDAALTATLGLDQD